MFLPAFLDPGTPRRSPRLGPPAPREPGDGAPQVCRMVFDEICVLANGDVVCSCGDPAGLRVYGNVKRDRIAKLYEGRGYREIRKWQLESRPAAFCPVINASCGGRVSRATSADTPVGRRVRTLQLEAVSTCNVRCPACPATVMGIDRNYAPDRRGLLPLAVMEDVVRQLPDLEKLLFYNFGEPFLHPYAVPFLRFVRRTRPDVTIHTSTNGLAFRHGVVEAIASEGLLDRVVFSIDGARPESYARYRRGGDLGKALAALRAMREVVAAAGTPVEVHWQYILFAWNDGDDEIARARSLAAEIGVPLKFIVTHTAGASVRFVYGSPDLAALVGEDAAYGAMTCDLKRDEMERSGGRAAGRYEAALACDRERVVAAAGSRVSLRLSVVNPTAVAWRKDHGEGFRIGVRLMNESGRTLGEVPGVAVPEGALDAGGRDEVLLPIVVPQPGRYELFVDVVEQWVCWFSERGSKPLLLPLVST